MSDFNYEEIYKSYIQACHERTYEIFCDALKLAVGEEHDLSIVTNGCERVFRACLFKTVENARNGDKRAQISLLIIKDRMTKFWEENKNIMIDKENLDLFNDISKKESINATQ